MRPTTCTDENPIDFAGEPCEPDHDLDLSLFEVESDEEDE